MNKIILSIIIVSSLVTSCKTGWIGLPTESLTVEKIPNYKTDTIITPLSIDLPGAHFHFHNSQTCVFVENTTITTIDTAVMWYK